MKKLFFLLTSTIVFSAQQSFAQKQDPAATEVWQPEPKIVTTDENQAPSDAFILFDGKNLSEWVSVKDNSPAKWEVSNGVFTVKKETGNIQTKKSFTDYQLHLEWQIPANITGTGQGR